MPVPTPVLHLFNGFLNPYGGSELETLSLYELLRADSEVHLWATSSRASAELMARYPIQKVSLRKGVYPRGGTYVFLGSHWRRKLWAAMIPVPRRLIYVFNTFHPKLLGMTTSRPWWLRWPKTEFVFISDFQRKILGVEAAVHPSPIDIDRFVPVPVQKDSFTIGRMSRDTPDKHHAGDIGLYTEWLQQGCSLIIQGGTSLQEQLPQHARCQLWPEGKVPAEAFFPLLDVLYYRTGQHVETFGRVVFEAMACGVPVVCHAHGGYADHIVHGENGFLFNTDDDARHWIGLLRNDVNLRERIGQAGRATVLQLFSDDAVQQRLAFYRQ
jgi:glycosyltransferase involved in cell wall biosynthesis